MRSPRSRRAAAGRVAGALAALVALAAGATGCAPALTARAQLVAGSPAPGAVVGAPPTTLELTFNRVLGEDSRVDLVAGATGEPLPLAPAIDEANPMKLKATLPGPLPPGSYQVRWHSVPDERGVPHDGAYSFAVEPERATQPRLWLAKARADSQEPVLLGGAGFTPRSTVTLAIADDGQPVGVAETDDQGAFRSTIVVPPDIPFGWQPIAVADASGARATLPLEVRWGGWPPLDAQVAARSGPGDGEVTFRVTVRNRSDYVLEAIQVVVAVPDGAVFERAGAGGAYADGRVTWTIPWLDRSLADPLELRLRADRPVEVQARVDYRHRRPRGCIGDGCLPAFISNAVSEPARGTPRDR
jgi:methionine-rich copper-binding protein CopC